MKAPSPPDPEKTAAAQAGLNSDTAQTQQLTNMIDTVGPNGSTTYTPNGENTFVGSDGKTHTVPKYTQTTTLSPEQQAIQDQLNGASLNLGTLANDKSAWLQDYLKNPFDADAASKATEDKLTSLAAQRLDPQWAGDEDKLRTQLINQGVQPGSQAFDDAMAGFNRSKTDAYNQLYLTGHGQAYNEAVQSHNQPLNEIIALMSGTQVQQPNTPAAPQAQVAGVDYTGLVNNQYQAKVNSQNQMMGGLFGLAAAPFGMFAF